MSANDGAITVRKPKSASAHTRVPGTTHNQNFCPQSGCSRPCVADGPAQMTRPCFLSCGAASRMKRNSPNPVRSTRLRTGFGYDLVGVDVHPVQRRHAPPMCTNGFIANTLSAVPSRNVTTPIRKRNVAAGGRRASPPVGLQPVIETSTPECRKVSRDRRRCRHHRTHQVSFVLRAPAVLPKLRLLVKPHRRPAGGCRGSCPDTSASRLAPLKTRLLKNPVQSFLLRCVLHSLRSRYHHRATFGTHLISLGYSTAARRSSRRELVATIRMNTRSMPLDLHTRLQPHILPTHARWPAGPLVSRRSTPVRTRSPAQPCRDFVPHVT